MIDFNCEHCGKDLRLDDSYAGRDGWCRACKQMVIVPAGGKTLRVEDLPKEEGYKRLQRLLQYAATKADKFKLHLAQQGQEDRRIPALEESLRQAREESNARYLEFQAARDEARTAEQDLEAARQQVESLQAAFTERDTKTREKHHSEISSLEMALSESHNEIETLRIRVKTLQDEQVQLHDQMVGQDNESTAASTALEGARNALQETLAERDAELEQARGEIRELTLRSEALQDQINASDESAGLIESLQASLAGAQEEKEAAASEIARLQEQLEAQASTQTTESQNAIEGLEADLARIKDALEQAETEKARLESERAAQADREKELADTIARQREEIQAQSDSLADLQSRQRERERTAESQRRDLEEQISLFSDLKERLAGLQEKVSSLDKERLDLTLALEDTQRLHTVEAKKTASLESRLDEAADEKARFLVQLEDLERDLACKDGQLDQLRDELKTLAADRSTADFDREKESRALQASEAHAKSLENELSETKQTLNDLRQSENALREELGALQATMATLESEANDASQDRNQALQDGAERIASLERELEKSQHQDEERKTELHRLTEALADAQATIEELTARLDSTPTAPENYDEYDADRVEIPPELMDDLDEELETVVLPEKISDAQRQRERQQMMDVLSDFLDK